MTVTLTYTCPVDDCGEQVEVEAEVEPGESNYGSDADGNRGIDVGPSVYTPETPATCTVCGTVYTDEQKGTISKLLESEANNYEFHNPLNDDFDPDWDRDEWEEG